MYSPRQRDLRERRIHQHGDEYRAAEPEETLDPEDGTEFDATAGWTLPLHTRVSAA